MAVLDVIRPEVQDKHVGRTYVVDVHIEMREDSQGEDALFITLVLDDPPEGYDSWPLEDLHALRDLLREVLARIEAPLEIPWYLSFQPEHPELDDDDQLNLGVDV